MEYWNIVIEFDRPYREDGIDEDILDVFAEWHPAVGSSEEHRLEAILSVCAEKLKQASDIASAIITTANGIAPTRAVRILRAVDFDRINGLKTVPPLMSVTEAASVLSVTRQRVLQMIHDNVLHGIKVGNNWALTRAEVDGMAKLDDNRIVH